MDFLRHQHLIFDNFAQENGQQNIKYAHKVGKKMTKSLENEEKICIFQFARKNLKTLYKVSFILRRRTTVRR